MLVHDVHYYCKFLFGVSHIFDRKYKNCCAITFDVGNFNVNFCIKKCFQATLFYDLFTL